MSTLHNATTPLEHGDNDLRFAIDSPFPSQMAVGKGTGLFVTGWCFHPTARIDGLEIAVDDSVWPVHVRDMPRPDVRAVYGVEHSEESGFWACIGLPGRDHPYRASFTLRVVLADGRRCLAHIGTMELFPCLDAEPIALPATLPGSTDPLVAIALTTFNPCHDLFVRQIESIRAQVHQNWIAVVVDDCSDPHVYDRIRAYLEGDNRFILYRNRTNLGFYRNFERCLSLLPKEAEFVALADQDDYWYPEKISTLLGAFRPGTMLVYADMRIVSQDGEVKSDSFWTVRRNNYRDMWSLLLANTVTGAASIFRREMLEDVLPFPQDFGHAFHDHWIALVALALGRIDYVDRPLHSYVQHRENIIGFQDYPARAVHVPWRDLLRRGSGRSMLPEPVLRASQSLGRHMYIHHVLRVSAVARSLEVRCGGRMERRKRSAVRRIAGLDESTRGLRWLVFRAIAKRRSYRVTVGVEQALLDGLIWRRLICRERGYASLEVPNEGAPGPSEEDQRVDFIVRKIEPLRLAVSGDVPRRINMLVSAIDLKHFSGGYITCFALARRLGEDGFRVRIVTVDPSDKIATIDDPRLESAAGLRAALQQVEVVHRYDRTKPIEANPGDAIIATSWWTAHIANTAMQSLGDRPFVYLIQEYEPCFYPTGTLHELARESYSFPHYALFSTEILRDYYRRHGIGVYGAGRESGERLSLSFQNPITNVGPVEASSLVRPTRRLLFYARPELHAIRNMFETGIIAVSRLVADGRFDGRWEFYGVGRASGPARVSLGDGVVMRLLGRLGPGEYRDLLRACDLGVGLIDSPHPSLVPLEMAAAGMVTVTNSFDTKTAAHLAAVSPNIITADPTVADIAAALDLAISRIDDYSARAAGSCLHWTVGADSSFDPEFLAGLRAFVEARSPGVVP